MEDGSHVLLITSRQITADAQAKKLDASRWINLDQLLDVDEREFEFLYSDIVHNVVCTNSGLEKFVRHHFSVVDPRTHLWNKFDYIILDEAHSLSTDATFSDAPFYVEKFLDYAIRHSGSSCRYIFMTGTLAPIKWLLNDYADEVHLTDYFEKCEEGINIMDEDISTMFSENHYYIDLVQMAGRVRKGLNKLYVIYDAKQNYDSFSRFDAEINRECVTAVNDAYSKYVAERRKHGDTVDTAQLIKRVENMFRCIRFNPITQAFETYEGKINGIMIFFLAPFANAKLHDLSAYCLRNIQPKIQIFLIDAGTLSPCDLS